MCKRSSLLLILGISLGSLISCSPGSELQRPDGQQEEQPRAGGTLRVAWGNPLPHYDIWEIPRTDTAAVAPAYSGILRFDDMDNNKIIPDLAQRWEVSPDGRRYTFFLHPNVKWHDGRAFTSADAKAALQRLIKPPEGAQIPYYTWLEAIERVDAPDSTTLVLYLKRPDASIPYVLADARFPIMPIHVIEAEGNMRRHVVGTGPFKLKEDKPGVSIRLEKFSDYFLPGRPYLDEVVFIVIPDQNTQAAAFETGQLDITGLSESAVTRLLQQYGEKAPVHINRGYWKTDMMSINTSKPPLDDVRVRQAINLAIDRVSMGKALSGEGFGWPRSFLGPEWSRDLEKRPGFGPNKDQDRAQAKRLLAEAGHPNGFEVPIVTRNSAGYVDKSEYVQGDLAKIGINVKIVNVPSAEWTRRLYAEDYMLTIAGENVAAEIPEAMWSKRLRYQELSFRDKTMEDLMEKISWSTDLAERQRLWTQLEDRLFEMVPAVPMIGQAQLQGIAPRVRGFGGMAGGTYNWRKFINVWLAQ